MSAREILQAAKALPLTNRIKLAQDLWETIGEDGYGPDPTPEQANELDRRAQDALNNPGRGTPIEDVSSKIRERMGGNENCALEKKFMGANLIS
jgi:putative addiction module component (TIGR02574 family)